MFSVVCFLFAFLLLVSIIPCCALVPHLFTKWFLTINKLFRFKKKKFDVFFSKLGVWDCLARIHIIVNKECFVNELVFYGECRLRNFIEIISAEISTLSSSNCKSASSDECLVESIFHVIVDRILILYFFLVC